MSEPQTYIAKAACGHIVACVVDVPAYYADTAKALGRWQQRGFAISKVETQSIRDGTAGEWCKCPRPKRGR